MLCVALLASLQPSFAPGPSASAGIGAITQGVVIGGLARGGRIPAPTDGLLAKLMTGPLGAPGAGDTVERPGGGTSTWKALSANEQGWFEDGALRGGYLFASVESEGGVRWLRASGHSFALVNGELRGGDPYAFGYTRVPVSLRRGANSFLFSVGRGRLQATLEEPAAEVAFDTGDTTLPDIVTGEIQAVTAGIVVINSRESPATGLQVLARCGTAVATTTLLRVGALSMRKVPVSIRYPRGLEPGKADVTLELIATDGRQRTSLHTTSVSLRVRTPLQGHRRTFLSAIDGSVQYYAVNPSQKPAATNALVLTLHGASVEGQGQADAYGSKDWVTLVAPTNRRPYGFDWEDWGRWDALEVLGLAEKAIPHDPLRVHVTGHSMGGHGTWHLGSTFPDRFGVIAPSAGWSSFFSYGGTPRWTDPTPIEALLNRAVSPSDTLVLASNTLSDAVYILHGDKDDNVPVGEARLMRETLEKLGHPRLEYHEQPGAGHWWGGECVDWPPLFELVQKTLRPKTSEVRSVKFTTANPAVSARAYWVTIDQQEHALMPSRIAVERVGGTAPELRGSTENVARLVIDRKAAPFVTAVLDGQRLDALALASAGSGRVVLERDRGLWRVRSGTALSGKRADRSGPFKEAFKNRMVFVIGTRGTAEENAAMSAKARYDAETFQYRGNGAVDIVTDRELARNPMRGRNLIVFGNADTNGAWSELRGCPIDVRRGSVKAGGRTLLGSDLAVLVVYPRSGDANALVGAVASTGRKGAMLADRLPYFVSGVAYPDWTVLGAEVALKGNAGIRAAGFFGNDWKFSEAESAWGQITPVQAP